MKAIAATIMGVMLVVASLAAAPFYLAGAQEQNATTSSEQAEITLDRSEVEAGSTVNVNGSNFGADDGISIYIMSAAQVEMDDGNATIMQEISSGQLQQESNESASDGSGNIIGDTLNNLGDLLGLGGDESADTSGDDNNNNTLQGNLLVFVDGSSMDGNNSIAVECDDQSVAEGGINGTLVSLEAAAGSYGECSVMISDEDGIVDSGSIGSFDVFPDADLGYENSMVESTSADGEGTFSASVIAPEEEGDYAILATGTDDDAAAVAAFSVVAQPAAATEEEDDDAAAENATGTDQQNATVSEEPVTNDTETPQFPLAEDNDTAVTPLTPAPPMEEQAENQTDATDATTANETTTNDTATTNATGNGEPSVQVSEADAEPGSPLAIAGDGFEPNTPVQVFINNVQITNVITNVQGSFNTIVVVPTTVNAGSAEVVVRTEQTNISQDIDIVVPPAGQQQQDEGPATLRFTAVSATNNARALEGAPVTVFDTRSGELVEAGDTPFDAELDEGTYSVFYSDFRNFDFASAEPGRWSDTPNGGAGLITVREGRNATVTAIYEQEQAPPAPKPPREPDNSLTLRAADTEGDRVQGMFVTVYDANTGDKIQQGFTEMAVEDLPPGTYPIFYANFRNLEFVSASPGTWVQTPFGGAGLVTIPDDGESHDVVVTAVYDRETEAAEEEVVFNIEAPLDVRGNIFTITSNETRPEGPFVISGTFALSVEDEDPLDASFSAYLVSIRDSSNENVDLGSQRSRDHDTFQIADFEAQVARPVGPDSYLVSGTADLLLNGDMYSNDERVQITVRGGEVMTPTNVEIEFDSDRRYSAENRLETLYGAVAQGFQ